MAQIFHKMHEETFMTYISRYQTVSSLLQAGKPGFNSWSRQEIFLLATASRLALGPTQSPIQWVLAVLSGVKQMGCEADHSPPSSAKVKKEWSYTSNPQHIFMAWCLVKHQE
jgi:hypothetical protein